MCVRERESGGGGGGEGGVPPRFELASAGVRVRSANHYITELPPKRGRSHVCIIFPLLHTATRVVLFNNLECYCVV